MKRTVLLLVLSVLSLAVSANPGRYQINQACIAVGCFIGDNPATTTIEITQSAGTFVLTSNLTFDDAQNGSPALLVSRPGSDSAVHIDLNGFEIRHTGVATSGTNGIEVIGVDSVVSIGNGRIVSFADGIHAIDGVTINISDMVFQTNNDDGVQMPLGSIRNSVFDNNNFSIFAVTSNNDFNGDRLIIEANQFFGVDQQGFSISGSNFCKDNMVAFSGANSNLGGCTLTGLNLCGNSPCVASNINLASHKE